MRGIVNAGLIISALLLALAGPATAAPFKLLLFGDSLAAGLGLDLGDGFAAKLAAALKRRGRDVVIVNASVSGDTSAGGLARVAWSLGDAPDAAVLELGANDGLRGLDPEATKANLDGVLRRFSAAGVPVLLTGMKAPPNLGRDYSRRFNAIFPALAKKHGLAFYPFFLEGVAAVRGLNQADGIHPNAAGVDVIVAGILPFVETLIARREK